MVILSCSFLVCKVLIMLDNQVIIVYNSVKMNHKRVLKNEFILIRMSKGMDVNIYYILGTIVYMHI